jgi:hypothetical protein
MLSWHKRVVKDKSQEQKDNESAFQQEPDPIIDQSEVLESKLVEGQKELESGDLSRSTNDGDLSYLPLEQWEAETSAVSRGTSHTQSIQRYLITTSGPCCFIGADRIFLLFNRQRSLL